MKKNDKIIWDSVANKLDKMLFIKNFKNSKFNNTHTLNIDELDEWCKKMLKSNSKIRYIKGRYPYKDYTHIDNLLKKYGNEMVNHLSSMCPIRHRKNADLYDSLAFVMYRLKVDPYSILEIPSFKSTWDKISDNNHI